MSRMFIGSAIGIGIKIVNGLFIHSFSAIIKWVVRMILPQVAGSLISEILDAPFKASNMNVSPGQLKQVAIEHIRSEAWSLALQIGSSGCICYDYECCIHQKNKADNEEADRRKGSKEVRKSAPTTGGVKNPHRFKLALLLSVKSGSTRRSSVVAALQEVAEAYLVGLFEDTNLCAIHACQASHYHA
ncbi:hypothetical protein IFM89_027284 [Coptis chinensis]|uniref:Histone H2A/H2B/H3 domain-containing protein n=1 Tax=Coptis chinensis TaxID=261450 RepID=A0A835H841_9MAGN|nr:hypothetical protein IFM89_027284 [Coptis chinensis]